MDKIALVVLVQKADSLFLMEVKVVLQLALLMMVEKVDLVAVAVAWHNVLVRSGGGGGYSGGQGGTWAGIKGGGGGGSINNGSNQSNSGAAREDHGQVIITKQ